MGLEVVALISWGLVADGPSVGVGDCACVGGLVEVGRLGRKRVGWERGGGERGVLVCHAVDALGGRNQMDSGRDLK